MLRNENMRCIAKSHLDYPSEIFIFVQRTDSMWLCKDTTRFLALQASYAVCTLSALPRPSSVTGGAQTVLQVGNLAGQIVHALLQLL